MLPTFDGEHEAFQPWWTKFRAYAMAEGFVQALSSKEADLSNSESVVLDPITQADAIGHTESDPQTNKWRQCQTDRVSVRNGSFKC